jgi:hypothetical protein
MRLITEVQIPDYPFRLDHRVPILMMGSCFAENMGSILQDYCFPVMVNPFGTIYNPASVLNSLAALQEKTAYEEQDLDQYKGRWFSFDHYTRFASTDREECLQRINDGFDKAKEHFKRAGYLIITWGTAWIFREKATGRTVSNCHRIPSTFFTRSRLTVEAIYEPYVDFLNALFSERPEYRVLLTVSPVRHWKDGAHGNQLSKATLLLAAEKLVSSFPSRVFYFPSYEIVMDELRDYRYYAEDMLHTSGQTSRYIWERFSSALLSEEARKVNLDLDLLLKLRRHRISGNSSEEAEAHEKAVEKKRKELLSKYPFIGL